MPLGTHSVRFNLWAIIDGIKKNERLKIERNVSFEQITMHIERGDVLDIVAHPNQEKYPNQQLLVVEINDYAYLVPFVENENGKF